MAFTCGFFNSQNGDRKYNAEQMASIFDGLIKDGVYDTVGDIFAVTPGTGMQVLVGSGRAWFDHTWNNNDAQYPLAITAADVSLPRYDAVVLETNHSDTVRTNRLRVLTGTPASNPVKPTMTSTANVKQHPLAYIKVTAGATAITQSMIQVVVGTSECPFVTGIIDTAQIDALFQQWNGEFNEWFENLKAQLSDNVVANLQGQIDQKVAKADVATTADIEAGTSTTKWVTPKGLKEAGIDGYKLGDVVCTARTDLGDDWALCNGGVTYNNDFKNILADSQFGLVTSDIITTNNIGLSSIENIVYLNGYYIIVGPIPSGSYSYPGVAWSTTFTGPYTVLRLPVANYYAVNIAYANNKYFIFIRQNGASKFGNTFYYADSLSSEPNNWTSMKTPSTADATMYVGDVRYYNGYYEFLAIDPDNYENALCFLDANKLGSSQNRWDGYLIGLGLISDYFHYNNNIVAGGRSIRPSSYSYSVYIRYFTYAPTGFNTANSIRIYNSGETNPYGGTFFYKEGDYYYLWYTYGGKRSTNPMAEASNWETVADNKTFFGCPYMSYPLESSVEDSKWFIKYMNNGFTVVKKSAYQNIITVPASSISSAPLFSSSSTGLPLMIHDNNLFIITTLNGVRSIAKNEIMDRMFILPTITTDKTYNYIKVK